MISDLFIKRPIATSLLAIGLAIAGIVAFIVLPVAPLPNIDFPTINVQASLPGASPAIMASSVATPLERQLGHIAGITEITSSSTLGATNIVMQFDLNRDINGAARDVQAAINAAQTYLPTNLPSNPTYRKVNPADAPILILALTSSINSAGEMYDFASSILSQKLSQINGVGQVIVGGSALPGVRIDVNPSQLAHAGISLNTVSQAVANANLHSALGQLQQNDHTAQIITNDQLFSAAEYRPLVVAYQNGSPVRLSAVANVINSIENIRTAGFADGKTAVVLIIFKQPGANVIATVDAITKQLPEFAALLPGTIKLERLIDRTTSIRASLHDIEFTLIAAIILVILVVYAFLGSVRSMLIPGVAVTLSLLGTFAFMYFFHFSLNNLSLMALTISTGFVIDDAIVVLENISRHIEAGIKPFQAAIKGTQEVGFTVMAMSLSLIAVFTPLIFMGGIVGRLFREFAVTLSIAILVSMLVSLTITPTMCAHFLHRQKEQAKNIILQKQQHFIRRFFSTIHKKYAASLDWALQHQRLMLLITVGAIAFNIALLFMVPKGFFPQQDSGRLTGTIVADQNISFQAMKQKLARLMDAIQRNPNVAHVVGFLGTKATNQGSIYINLKPPPTRTLTSDQVIAQLRPELDRIQGSSLYLQTAQDLMIGAHTTGAQYQYTLSDINLDTINLWAPRILKKLAQTKGIMDLNSDQQDHGLQVYVNVNHESALRLGVITQAIDQALYQAFGQNQVSTLYAPLNQYHIVLEAAPEFWQDPKILDVITAPSLTGQMVPLSSFAQFQTGPTLLAVNHSGLFPSATLSFNLLPGVALGDVVNRIEHTVGNMSLPSSMHLAFQGTAQAFQASLKSEPYLILAALLAVYIVLGILYESWIHPLTILSTLPSAGIGAILALLATHTELSLIAFIGIILLIGIVKKNAIMMIDVALTLQRTEQLSATDAIYRAALLRFRPIMMTTMAALLGACPLALATGVGSELYKPLGIAIIGGLMISQILTLYTTPVVYLYFDRNQY